MKKHPDQMGLPNLDGAIDDALEASKRAIEEAEARGQKLTSIQKSQADAGALAAALDQLGRPIHGAPVVAPKGTAVGAFRKIRSGRGRR